uniref:Uncharacterized protein n=2 Tax=Opuntia streptacantha TaxID=393608 RepID=A0A7C9DIC5_OPUST
MGLVAVRAVDTMSETVHQHPLALLAEEMKKLLEKETTLFVPVLSKWHSQSPFLDEAEHLTKDVASVFAAANDLEYYMLSLLMSVLDKETAEAYWKQLARYENIGGAAVFLSTIAKASKLAMSGCWV